MSDQIDRAYSTSDRLVEVARWLAPNEPIGVTKQEWSDLWALWYHRFPDSPGPEHPVSLGGHRLIRCPDVTFVTGT